MSISKSNHLMKHINSTLIDLPSPSNINYLWNFGSLLGLCFAIQLITGIFLAMHYCGDVILAFKSMVHMYSDVNYGFLLKSIHANGASLFFICVYIHIGKSLYYGGYQKKPIWFSGMVMFMVMMITAFMGYVLPWGQMSFWGATVITNFLSAIPYMGDDMVQWIWGGFSVNNATLGSFFSLHYLFPFVLASLILIHMMLMHSVGSSNPLGINSNFDKVPFHWYFAIKDIYGFFMLIFILLFMVFFYTNTLGDPENFINANSLVTPVHMMPEWYFLFAYAMLSSMPNKLGGVLALILSMMVLFMIPFLHTNKFFSLTFSPMGKLLYWMFMVNFMLLTWLGSKPMETPYMGISMISSLFYFFYFLFIMPIMGKLENYLFFQKMSV